MLLFTASIKIQPKLSNEVTDKSGRISFTRRKRIAHHAKPGFKQVDFRYDIAGALPEGGKT
jgi:hypothetical protein